MISDRDGTIGGPARGNLSGDRYPADRINPNRAAAAGKNSECKTAILVAGTFQEDRDLPVSISN
mgnify:CR=1 FL=1